jgi:hypothetical protein
VQRGASWSPAAPHSVLARRDLRSGLPFFIAIVCAAAVIAAALPETIAKVDHDPLND